MYQKLFATNVTQLKDDAQRQEARQLEEAAFAYMLSYFEPFLNHLCEFFEAFHIRESFVTVRTIPSIRFNSSSSLPELIVVSSRRVKCVSFLKHFIFRRHFILAACSCGNAQRHLARAFAFQRWLKAGQIAMVLIFRGCTNLV